VFEEEWDDDRYTQVVRVSGLIKDTYDSSAEGDQSLLIGDDKSSQNGSVLQVTLPDQTYLKTTLRTLREWGWDRGYLQVVKELYQELHKCCFLYPTEK
jgi:hypothetical protein